MKRILVGIISFIFSFSCMGQTVKFYNSLSDYITEKNETPNNVELRELNFIEQRRARKAEYYFWTTDRALAYHIGSDVNIAEYGEKLFLNTAKVNYDNKKLGNGFALLYFKNGLFYLTTINPGGRIEINLTTNTPLSNSFGENGDKLLNQILYKTVGSIKRPEDLYLDGYYFASFIFDPKTAKIRYLQKTDLLNLLHENNDLLNLYLKEEQTDNIAVIDLYTRAYFKYIDEKNAKNEDWNYTTKAR